MNKPTKWQSAINVVHKDWCRDNGYPTNWYRPRYGKPPMHKRKGTSEQIERTQDESNKNNTAITTLCR